MPPMMMFGQRAHPMNLLTLLMLSIQREGRELPRTVYVSEEMLTTLQEYRIPARCLPIGDWNYAEENPEENSFK